MYVVKVTFVPCYQCTSTQAGLARQLATPWHDVQSCAVDPGAVRSSIWKRAGPIMQWVANHLFAPNEDGCQTVIHAATDSWEPAPQPSDTKQQAPTLRVMSTHLAVSHAVFDKLAFTFLLHSQKRCVSLECTAVCQHEISCM